MSKVKVGVIGLGAWGWNVGRCFYELPGCELVACCDLNDARRTAAEAASVLPWASRTRAPSLLGRRPPVSTSVPSLSDCWTNLPIASISACGGADSRYDSEWRMKVRYFTRVDSHVAR